MKWKSSKFLNGGNDRGKVKKKKEKLTRKSANGGRKSWTF
jgi:hypothetical protein